ncbi:MAG: hypothetical protein HYU66_02365 [Armatimonadetes bacterium]|nr:hypothetical protein [Armatimonadota bacterium]
MAGPRRFLLLPALLTAGLLRAAPIDEPLRELQPWPARLALQRLLEETRAAPAAAAWERLAALLLVDPPEGDPAKLETDRDALLAHAAGLAWRGGQAPARVVALVKLLGELSAAAPDLLLTGARAAQRTGNPMAPAWLEAACAQGGVEVRAAAAEELARLHHAAGRDDEALAWLARAGTAPPWLEAELTAGSRTKEIGLPLEFQVEAPEALSLRDGDLANALVLTLTNRAAKPVALTVSCAVPKLTEPDRRMLTLAPAASTRLELRPALAADADPLALAGRDVALALAATLDAAGGPAPVWDTVFRVPLLAPPLQTAEHAWDAPSAPADAVAACLMHCQEAGPVGLPSELATHWQRDDPAPPDGRDVAPGLRAVSLRWPGDDVADPPDLEVARALALLVARLGFPARLVAVGGRPFVGWWPAPAYGLVRLADADGAPLRPAGDPIPDAASRRLGFLPTRSGETMQLELNRDGLPAKRGQTLGLAVLSDGEPPDGAVALTVTTPAGRAAFVDVAALRRLGLPSGLAGGAAAVLPALLAAEWAAQPEACLRIARSELKRVQAEAQPFETLLEGRYGLLLREAHGFSFFGDARPLREPAAARALDAAQEAYAKALLERLEELRRERFEWWRLLTAQRLRETDPSLTALLLPPADGCLERVVPGR